LASHLSVDLRLAPNHNHIAVHIAIDGGVSKNHDDFARPLAGLEDNVLHDGNPFLALAPATVTAVTTSPWLEDGLTLILVGVLGDFGLGFFIFDGVLANFSFGLFILDSILRTEVKATHSK